MGCQQACEPGGGRSRGMDTVYARHRLHGGDSDGGGGHVEGPSVPSRGDQRARSSGGLLALDFVCACLFPPRRMFPPGRSGTTVRYQ